MAEVISWASAVFSIGWILYESGQVMTFMTFCKNVRITFPSCTLLSLARDHLMDRTLLLSEMRLELSEGASWWNICHNITLFTASIDMEIRKVFANFEHERREEVCRGTGGEVVSLLKVKLSWIFDIPDSSPCARAPLSVQVGFSFLSGPSPGSPPVSGVDNPVGDRAHSPPIFCI